MLKARSTHYLWLAFVIIAATIFVCSSTMSAQTTAPKPAGAATDTGAPKNPNKGDPGAYNAVPDLNEMQDPNEVKELNRYNAHFYKLLIDAFERPGEWSGQMPREYGVIELRRRYGAAEQLLSEDARKAQESAETQKKRLLEGRPFPDVLFEEGETIPSYVSTPPRYQRADGKYEERYFTDYNYPEGGLTITGRDSERTVEIKNQRVLGVKVTFFRRGNSEFTISPPNDIWIDGIAKGIEVFINGRQKPHTVYALLEDIKGREIKVKLCDLDFRGWRRISVPIPPTVVQFDSNRNMKRGLKFKGFQINVDPVTALGEFYVYFDNLSFLVDRYFEETQSEAQMSDMW